MDLTTLSKEDLDEEFMRINVAYTAASKSTITAFFLSQEYHGLSEHMLEILHELKRRRGILFIREIL